MTIADGFPGQRMRVLAEPRVRQALATAPSDVLLVTDAGYFPHAEHHGRRRPRGASELVVIVCTAGRGECWSDHGRLRVAAGQAVLIAPGVPHRYAADAADPWTIWWLHLAGSAVASWARALAPDGLGLVDLSDPTEAVAQVSGALDALDGATDDADLVDAAQHAWGLLSLLGRDRQGRVVPGDPVDRVQALLSARPEAQVSVAELAAMVQVSPSRLGALFRAATGGGVQAFQQRVRMSRARELLAVTDLSVAEVASRVGYGDPLYFSRQFRRVHAESPTAFRQRSRASSWPGDGAGTMDACSGA